MTAIDGIRDLYFTEQAMNDAEWIKLDKKEWEAIRNELIKLQHSWDISKEKKVTKLTDFGGWYRLKLVAPSQMRVFFTITGYHQDITVVAILRRTDRTYDIAQIFYNTRKGKQVIK